MVSCLNKRVDEKQYKTLQEKYKASEEVLDTAIYSWGNSHKKTVNRDGGIDLKNKSLQKYLDKFFKLKSENTFTSERDYKEALQVFETIPTTEFKKKSAAIKLYKFLVDAFGKENVIMYESLEGKTIVRAAKPVLIKDNTEDEDDTDNSDSTDVVKEAKDKLNEVRRNLESRIKFNRESHTYTIYDSAEDKANDVNGHEAISVTQYIHGKKDIGSWGTPSSAIGNTNDAIVRDFFKGQLKPSYPNFTSSQLKNFIEDLEILKDYFKEVHGENCEFITDEFPIAGKYTVMVKGKPEVRYMAGTMDMIIIDKNGKYWGYDMKAKRNGVSPADSVNFGNQLGLYGAILSPYGIELENTKIIHSKTYYDGPIDAKYGAGNAIYTVDENGQLYDKGIKVQDVPGYSAPRLALTDTDEVGSDTIVSVSISKGTKKLADEMAALSKEDRELMEEEIGSVKPTKSSSMTYKGRRSAAKSGLYNPLLSASERKFLANQVMQQLSSIVTHLQSSKAANNSKGGYFPDGKYATTDFTSMSREEIIKTIGVGELFLLVKNRIFKKALSTATTYDTQSKLMLAYNNFNDLINEGYSKLITLEGVTVVNLAEDENVIEDMGDENLPENNDEGTLEEKEREYWQLGQRQISAKSSLSKEIRRMFERLQVLDENGQPIVDKFGFRFATFVDSNTAVNNILEWCKDCSTIEEMENILRGKVDSYPYLNTILEKIKEEPIRSLFYKNFRKDFTTYSIVTVQTDNDGNRVYSVHTINTKGATKTIMKNLTTRFSIGGMQNLIMTKDTIEGKGRVNIPSVKAILEDKERVVKELSDAFYNKSKYKKLLKSQSVVIMSLLNKLGIQIMEMPVYNTIKKDSEISDIENTASFQILSKIGYIAQTLLNNKDARDYNPMDKERKEGNTYSTYKSVVEILSRNIEDSIEASTYENGKMYYSFVTPSYMGSLITSLKNAIDNDKKFKEFLKENYSSYRWFYESTATEGNKWNNTWLQQLAESKEAKRILEHKVQLNFGKTPYDELSELGYTLSLMTEYFSDKNKRWAWYRLPILSNKPSSEFIRFFRYSGKDYKREIKRNLKKVVNQEILRIRTTLERAVLASDSGVSKIANIDIDLNLLQKYLGKEDTSELLRRIKNKKITSEDLVNIRNAMNVGGRHSGAEFRFLELLNNEFEENTELASILVDKINDKVLNAERTNKLDELLLGTNRGRNNDGAIDKYMRMVVEHEFEQWDSIGLFNSQKIEKKNKKGEVISEKTQFKYLNILGESLEEVQDNLEEYIWNDMFATINIIQLTTTDLAYYKNMEDFQKRFAQVHSPAMRLNTEAEYKGVKVSDGQSRTIYIKDLKRNSEIIPNVKAIFDKKIAQAKTSREKNQLKITRDTILSSFERVNVTDAQAYSSPTSYRKKMIMAGTWDENMEKAYQKILSGNYNLNDLQVVWQPLKPFVYSQIRKSTGVSAMSEIKVGVQNKNSEYMLLIADALMRGNGMKSTLGAIFDFMEQSHLERDENGKPIKGTYRQDGIDTIQFESAVKVGLMGVIDINDKSYSEVIRILEDNAYYSLNKQPSVDNNMDRYNDQFVHTISYSDYGIQQEVPDHLRDHSQAMGSQVRILSISDISEGAMFNVRNQKRPWDRDHLINRYQELHAANIKESFNKLAKELNLTDKHGNIITDKKVRNEALSKILKEAIEKDQRYGSDLRRACTLDSNGDFIIPPNDPIQSIRIQQLINSIIKSRINKQKVKGGPIVQASVYGVSDDLHIVFKGKDGKPLRTRKENESIEDYQKFLEENQAGLHHVESYMTVPSKEMEEALMQEDGSLMDVEEAVKQGIISEEMLKAIAYRIPTEDKYSMMPIEIKGFLPRAAGEAIMLPREITLLTGSDFDIDKMYVMFKEFTSRQPDIEKFIKAVIESYGKKKSKTEVKRDTDTITTWIRELAKDGKITTKFSGKHIPVLQRQIEALWNTRSKDIQQTFVEKTVGNLGKESIATRNNEIFDIQWAVLTHEDTLSKMFNPGSFDIQKRTAAIIKAVKAGSNMSYKELSSMNLDDLNSLSGSSTGSIIFPTTQVAFHKQNMTAGKLIGIFANNNTSHAFLSMQGIKLQLTKDTAFVFDGRPVNNAKNNLLDKQYAFDGSLISKNIASFLAASVDAVKDPVLNFMNLNTFTSGPAMLLTRLGFDSDSIGLFLTQPIIEKVTREFFKQNNDGYVSVEDIIKQELNNNTKEWSKLDKNLAATPFTKEDLLNSLAKGIDSGEYQARVLLLFKRLASMSNHLNTLTFLTKFNSVTNAVGPTIADTLVMKEKYKKFIQLMTGAKSRRPFWDNAVNVIENSPILKAFYDCTVGSRGAAELIFYPYFPHYSIKFKELLELVRETTKAQLDAKTINSLINDFILYKLTAGDNPIINSSFYQRDRFINKFPSEVVSQLIELTENGNELAMSTIVEPKNKKCPVATISASVSGGNADFQERIKTAWSSLMENPDTFELGRDLFLYNLYRSGFTYSPKTFLHLASVDTKLALGDYIDAVGNTTFNDSNVSIAEFLLMFRRNHAGNTKIVPSLEINSKSGNTRVSANTNNKGKIELTISYDAAQTGLDSVIANRKSASIVFSPVVTYNGKLYYTDNYEIPGSTGRVTYTEISPLGNTNNFLEYNANESAVDMVSVLGKSNKIVKEKPESKGPEKSDDEVDYGHSFGELTDEEVEFLFAEDGPLARYRNDIMEIGEEEGDEAAFNKTMELMKKFVATTKRKKAKEKVMEIINRFCK